MDIPRIFTISEANTVSIIRLQRKSTPRWAMRYA